MEIIHEPHGPDLRDWELAKAADGARAGGARLIGPQEA